MSFRDLTFILDSATTLFWKSVSILHAILNSIVNENYSWNHFPANWQKYEFIRYLGHVFMRTDIRNIFTNAGVLINQFPYEATKLGSPKTDITKLQGTIPLLNIVPDPFNT